MKAQCTYNSLVDIDLSNMLGTGRNTASDLYAFQSAPSFGSGNVLNLSNPTPFWGASGTTPNIAFGQNLASGGTSNTAKIVINGTFIVDRDMHFDHADVLMGPLGKIIVRSGSFLYINDAYFHSCSDNVGGQPQMWDGIYAEQGASIFVQGNVTIEDAQVAISVANNANYWIANNVRFNKNYIGIRIDGNRSSQKEISRNVEFTCLNYLTTPASAATLLPPYSGKRSFAGVIATDCDNLSISEEITVSPGKITFKNLDFGIRAYNSNVKVVNTDFIDIGNSNFPQVAKDEIGTAIYFDSYSLADGSSPRLIDIGTSNYPPDACAFSNCKRGIYVKRNANIKVSYSTFDNCTYSAVDLNNTRRQLINIKGNTVTNCLQGFRFINCIQSDNFEVNQNKFYTSNGLTAIVKNLNSQLAINFPNTSILAINTPLAPSGINIHDNEMENSRIGIYQNGLSDFTIQDNWIKVSRDLPITGFNHFGLWIDNSTIGSINDNTIEYLGAATTNTAGMRGFNIKGTQNCDFISNKLNNCGTAVRIVDQCQFTNFTCNRYDNCNQGTLLQKAAVTQQGSNNNPVDEQWYNFGGNNRYTGTLFGVNYLDFFHRNATQTSSPFAPVPNNVPSFATLGNTSGNSVCLTQDPPDYLTEQEISNTVNRTLTSNQQDSINFYFKEKNAVYKYLLARKDSLDPTSSFYNWLILNETKSIGAFASLSNVDAIRESLLTTLQSLPYDSIVSQNVRTSINRVALENQLNSSETIAHDTTILFSLSQTNSWLGSDAVFLARAILEEEVDDIELGLRMGNVINESQCNLAIYYGQSLEILDRNNPTYFSAFDVIGRTIVSKKVASNLSADELTTLKSKGAFVIKVESATCFNTFKL